MHQLPDLPSFSKVERIGRGRMNSIQMADYIAELCDRDFYSFGIVNPKLEALYKRIGSCSSRLTLRHYIEQDESRVIGGTFCGRHLLCQPCAILRSGNLVRIAMPKLEALVASGLRPYLVTFTVRNGVDLYERLNHLRTAFRSLLNRARVFRKTGRGFTEWGCVEAGLYSFEVTGIPLDWHPHIHALVFCKGDGPSPGWVSDGVGTIQSCGLRGEWFDLTQDSYQVDIRPVHAADPDDLVGACCEVMKYATKMSCSPCADTWYIYQAVRGQRLLGTLGLLRGLKLPDEVLEPKLSGPFIDYFLRYWQQGLYQVTGSDDHTENGGDVVALDKVASDWDCITTLNRGSNPA